MASKLILGIDPGLSGGLALLQAGEVVKAVNTPTVTITRSRGEKRRELAIGDIYFTILAWDPDIVIIESQQAMPKQGVSSTFATGKNYGILLGILTAVGQPYEVIRPQAWKKALGVTSDKQTAFDKADEIFPGAGLQFWPRKKDDGVCEAALIAHYGALKHETD